jgi:hypothetical protein
LRGGRKGEFFEVPHCLSIAPRIIKQVQHPHVPSAKLWQHGHTIRTCATVVGNEKGGAKTEEQAQKEAGNITLQV